MLLPVLTLLEVVPHKVGFEDVGQGQLFFPFPLCPLVGMAPCGPRGFMSF